MTEHARMLDEAKEPEAVQVAQWIGSENSVRWTELIEFIQSRYPGVFETKWWFGGRKFGWSLRFKKSKSFCNLIPERGQFKVLLVFGAEEREKLAAVLPDLVSHVRDDYAKATTFHDGRWVSVVVDSKKVLAEVERLLVLKRTPRAEKASAAKLLRKKGSAANASAAPSRRATSSRRESLPPACAGAGSGSEEPVHFGRPPGGRECRQGVSSDRGRTDAELRLRR